MAKISRQTAIQRLVQFYTDTENLQDSLGYLYGITQQFREEYDRRMSHAPMDWDFFLGGKTTDKNVHRHAQQTLTAFFESHDYEYILACYKTAKQAAKDVA